MPRKRHPNFSAIQAGRAYRKGMGGRIALKPPVQKARERRTAYNTRP